ncbi:hypothetical protein [Gemmatimonas sp.]|uniref:hypothetical protein n=1 Tax=Gemmatimonas sp. TaxID=1962908 RepID=UPI003983C7B6
MLALLAVEVRAQSTSTPQPGDKGIYLGATVGQYFESAEGKHGSAPAGSGILGYQFGPKWAMQLEYGRTGTSYCYQQVAIAGGGFYHVAVPKKNPPAGSICHSDPIGGLDVIRRFGPSRTRPYVALGLGAGLHLGFGVEIEARQRFVIAPALDLNYAGDAGSARPRVAFLVRF